MKQILMVALLVAGSASAQEVNRPPDVTTASSQSIFYDGTHFGLQVDAGFPTGASIGVVARPWKFLRVNAGIAHDVIAFGYKGGITLIPFHWGVTPTLSLEAGHFTEGNVNDIVKISDKSTSTLLSNVGFSYYSADLGLEIGSQNRFVFYIRAGLTNISSSTNNVTAALSAANTTSGTTYSAPRGGNLDARVPTARLGFILYMF